MSKFLRDLTRIAEEEGYDYEGYAGGSGSGAGSGHHVFIHRTSGAVVRTSSTPKNAGNALKGARSSFVTAKRSTTSSAAAFRRFMLRKYKVGKNGSKVVEVTVRDLTEEFNSTHPETQITNGHVTVMLGNDPMFERLKLVQGGKGHGRGHSVTTLRISGPGYGLVKEQEPEVDMSLVCGATFQTPEKGIAVCVLAQGHPGLHWDSYRNTRWADGSGILQTQQPVFSEPVIDPVAAEAIHALPKLVDQVTQTPAPPVLEPVMVGGLTLSEELADQLRDALGGPSTALAAENQDRAVAALLEAQDALQIALDAIKGMPVKKNTRPSDGRNVRIGRVQRQRLDQIKQLVADGSLPNPFTVQQVMKLAPQETEGAIVSTLSRGNTIGDTVRRVARSTYEVR